MKKQTEPFVLRRHHLTHIPELGVEKGFLDKNFARGCSMYHCNSQCCRHGVMIDPDEKQNILNHAEMIQRYMEPHQDKDPSSWFDDTDEVDADFPSGRALGTQMKSYGCIFLDTAGRCTLQKAAMGEGLPKFSLKPFYCVAYPLTIEDGVLVMDDPDFVGRSECCSIVPNGEQSVFDVCPEELEFVLGKEGMQELKEHNHTSSKS